MLCCPDVAADVMTAQYQCRPEFKCQLLSTLFCKGAESQVIVCRSSSPESKESLEMLLAKLRLELAEHQSSKGQHMALDKVRYAYWAFWLNPCLA